MARETKKQIANQLAAAKMAYESLPVITQVKVRTTLVSAAFPAAIESAVTGQFVP